MNHPIPVRRMNLDPIPLDEFNPVCIANNALLSYTFWGSSLYVALLEPFIVKSMRSVMDEIRDDELRENVDRFSRQEAQHYQQHQRFNETLFAQGYPGLQQRYDRLKLDFARMTSEESDRYCVGFVEGFEAYTTQSALLILKSGLLKHPRTDARVGDLMSWHLMEEIVHGLLTFSLARVFRLDAETTAVASQAAVGGPSTAMALATSRGWADLALPGLMVGLLGYAVGNFAGLGIAFAIRAALGSG